MGKGDRKCWACQEPLQHVNAVICTSCDSWQNWRRILNISTVSLSMLLALISVSALLVQNYQNLSAKLYPKSSILSFGSFFTSDPVTGRQITFLADDASMTLSLSLKSINTGNSSIILPETVFCRDSMDAEPVLFTRRSFDQSLILEPAEVSEIVYDASDLRWLGWAEITNAGCVFVHLNNFGEIYESFSKITQLPNQNPSIQLEVTF